MKLPSGMTTEQLREHIEGELVKGTSEAGVLLRPVDILAVLVALDLRERLDQDVHRCARSAKATAEQHPGRDRQEFRDLLDAAERVLKHEPLPDMTKAPS